MPTFIQHRVNRLESLLDCDTQGGVEIDIRSSVDHVQKLHLSHDPWQRGVDFDLWLEKYAEMGFAGPLILNTKEDGLEHAVVERLGSFRVDNYFFLDTCAPTLRRCIALGWGQHMALRISQFETSAAVEPWLAPTPGNAKVPGPGWLWIDCFDGQPLPIETIRRFAGRLRLCMVSPELQGQPRESISHFQHFAQDVDAVCTKHPSFWKTAARMKRAEEAFASIQ